VPNQPLPSTKVFAPSGLYPSPDMSTSIPEIASYGSWISPITSALIASESVGLAEVRLDSNDVYWESRPHERGRHVVVRRPLAGGEATDVIRAPFSARTRVHEYSSGAWAISDGTLYFSNDQARAGRKPDRRQRTSNTSLALNENLSIR
jgi:hypothetical protein